VTLLCSLDGFDLHGCRPEWYSDIGCLDWAMELLSDLKISKMHSNWISKALAAYEGYVMEIET